MIHYSIKFSFISTTAVTCPAGQVFRECGSSCERTCQDLSSHRKCTDKCVAGCGCPDGQLLDALDTCVDRFQCPCVRNGKKYHPGAVIIEQKCEKWYLSFYYFFGGRFLNFFYTPKLILKLIFNIMYD